MAWHGMAWHGNQGMAGGPSVHRHANWDLPSNPRAKPALPARCPFALRQAPQLDINTVAAGGGSRLFFRSGVFQVGGI